jgi:hypothetical protein
MGGEVLRFARSAALAASDATSTEAQHALTHAQQPETAALYAGRVVHSAHDVTGRRLATASEGQELRVFEKTVDGWGVCATWKVRGGALLSRRRRCAQRAC